MTRSHRVRSADGTRLAVHESGPADAPVLVAVHGYPDDHTVWDGVAALLTERYRVVRYDVRGAGGSDAPVDRDGYRADRLVADLAAVLDAAAPAGAVQLLGHDWGSVQLWPALTDPRLRGRLAGFTSLSGPSLEHTAWWFRHARQRLGPAAWQLRHSAYTVLFRLPGVPERAIRAGLLDHAAGRRVDRATAVHGLELYRANLFRGGLPRGRPARVDVPVQVIAPRADPYIGPELATEAPAPHVRELRTRVVPGGHWLPSERPELVAAAVHEFALRVGGGRAGAG